MGLNSKIIKIIGTNAVKYATKSQELKFNDIGQ